MDTDQSMTSLLKATAKPTIHQCSKNKQQLKQHSGQNQIIKSLIALVNNHTDVEILWLYGSRARNTANLYSDYDLAVAFQALY